MILIPGKLYTFKQTRSLKCKNISAWAGLNPTDIIVYLQLEEKGIWDCALFLHKTNIVSFLTYKAACNYSDFLVEYK